jgi:single-strand DNA-binding protein
VPGRGAGAGCERWYTNVANDNQVMLVGNLTDDPELRFTPNGAAVANFRLAVTPRVREGDSWKDGETSFFRINVWRQQAENVAETLQKGTRCIVVGRLRTRSWETPEGEKRSVTEVEADEIGPSLKFATAKVERSSRGGSGGGGGGDWAGSAAGASKGGQFNDEPPF